MAFMVAAEAVFMAVVASTSVGTTAAVAPMADEEVSMAVMLPTEVAAPSEACAEVQAGGKIQVREGPGLGRAEAPGTLRPAGIRLHDRATAI